MTTILPGRPADEAGFADTSYFIAVIAANDVVHERAQKFANQSLRIVTSAWVMTELAAYLSAPANRPLFSLLIRSLRTNSEVDFIDTRKTIFDQSVALYESRTDKHWSLVDCTSFIIMQRQRLIDALTTDHHFTQAGFNALLIDPTT